MKKFKNRKTAVGLVWKALSGLGEPVPPTKAPVAPQKPKVAASKSQSSQSPKQAMTATKAPNGRSAAAPQKPDVAPKKGKPRKKARSAEKGPKRPAQAETPDQPTTARPGSKKAVVVGLLKRPGGATLRDLMVNTGWQAHSVRGFISGALGTKMGLTVNSERREDGERVYTLVS